MKKIRMTIELLSDTLPGSGKGFGAVIDSDVQYDECGIPYFPSKRVKGSLRNSLNDLLEMPAVWNALNIKDKENKERILDSVFGKRGEVQPSIFEISDFQIKDYGSVKSWFNYLKYQYPDILSNEKILSTLTNIRRQTSIKDGVAIEHSLRSSRVVNKGLIFEAYIDFDNDNKDNEQLLALACANLRRIGLKRNRGLGSIKCELEKDLTKTAISNLKKELEEK